jgi:Tfp pilus assembly PilM family ATPase
MWFRRTRLDVHVGLDLSPGRLKLVALSGGPSEPVVESATDLVLGPVEDGRGTRFDAAAVGGEIAALLARQRLKPRSITLSLGPAEAIARRLTVVDQAHEQMFAAVSLQLGQALGTDVAAPRVSWTPLPVPAAPGRRTVFAAAARPEAVAAQQRAVTIAGCEQGPVVPAAAAILNAWRRWPAREASEGAVVLLHVGHSAALWIVLDGSEPAAMDAPLVGVASVRERLGVGRGGGGDPLALPAALLTEWAGRLRQEIARGLQVSRRESGRGEESGFEVWMSGGGARVPGLMEALGSALGAPVHLYDPLDALGGAPSEVFGPALVPALGAALQGMAGEGDAGELLLHTDLRVPAESRTASSGRMPLPVVLRQAARDPAWRGLLAAGAVLWAMAGYLDARVSAAERVADERERRATEDSAAVAASMSRMELLQARRQALGARVDAVAALEGSRYAWPRLMHAVAGSVPDAAWVSAILSDGEDPATGAVSFRLRGYAATDAVAGWFARRLAGTGAVADAQVIRTSTVTIGRSPVVEFELTGRTAEVVDGPADGGLAP